VGEDIIWKKVTWTKWRCEWFWIPCWIWRGEARGFERDELDILYRE